MKFVCKEFQLEDDELCMHWKWQHSRVVEFECWIVVVG
jgi:hypothetical protein